MSGSDPVSSLLLLMITALVGSKLLGELAYRLGQSSVLGELLAGAILGPYALGWIPVDDHLHLWMELGVLLLLLEAGLETSLSVLWRVGKQALAVASAGVLFPLGLGIGASWFSGLGWGASLTIGATLTATSIGLTARTLQDLDEADSREGRIILGAAVLDDIIGLILLALLQSALGGQTFQPLPLLGKLALFTVVCAGFYWGLQPLFNQLDRLRNPTVWWPLVLAVTLALCWVSHWCGLSIVIGAFAAGLLINRTHQSGTVHHAVQPLSQWLSPLFFVGVGAQLDLGRLNPFWADNWGRLGLVLMLTLLAVVGKLAAGWTIRKPGVRRALIGMGMVPRGEVGLIFAQVGLTTGVLTDDLFSVLVAVVLLTTFVTPLGLAGLQQMYRKKSLTPALTAS